LSLLVFFAGAAPGCGHDGDGDGHGGGGGGGGGSGGGGPDEDGTGPLTSFVRTDESGDVYTTL